MRITTIVLLIFIASVPVMAIGHGSGGFVEANLDEYILSIGYDRLVLVAGETVELDFDLFNKMRQPVEYSTVLVEINKDDELLFAGFIDKMDSVFVPAILDYRFQEGGIYEFYIKFYRDGQSIVDGTLELEVENWAWYKNQLFAGLLVGFLIGAGIVFLVLRFKN